MRELWRNNHGQVLMFRVLFISIIFVLLLATGLGKFITTVSGLAVSTAGLTGIEAFFLDNLLLWILFAFTIWILWVTQ